MHVVYGLATRLGLVYTPFDDGEYSHPLGTWGPVKIKYQI